MPQRFVRALVLALLSVAAATALPVAGTVFRDANANGRRDAGEPGWAGIALTDGQVFTVTDADGHYRFEATGDPLRGAGAEPLVELSWPTGAWPSGPWFRRVGPGVDAAAVDFGLKPAEQKLPFRFVHGTDAHVPRGGQSKFTDFRAEVTAQAPQTAFTVLTGDNVDLSDSHPFTQGKAEWELFAADTRDWPTPLFVLTGNHDIAGVRAKPGVGWESTNPLYGYGFYTNIVGPLRWSFDYADVHFAAVDFNSLTDGKWAWGIPSGALDWLKADLARVPAGRRIYLFMHYPQSPDKRFGELLKDGHATQIFAGHSHVDRAFKSNGVPVLIGGSLGQVFDDKDRETGYRLVEVTADGFDSFYKATAQPHAITVDQPRYEQPLKPEQTVAGQFYDPAAQIKTLTVAVGDVTADVPFTRGSLACRFSVKFDLSKLTPGPQPLVVTVGDGAQTWSWKYTYKLGKVVKATGQN